MPQGHQTRQYPSEKLRPARGHVDRLWLCVGQNPYDCPGSISYLAPEKVEGQAHGPAVDYWSCGVVRLKLVLGKVVGSRILLGHSLAQYQDCLRPSESPLNVCALAMLQLDPDFRMTVAEALPYLQDLEETRPSRLMRSNRTASKIGLGMMLYYTLEFAVQRSSIEFIYRSAKPRQSIVISS